MLFDGDFYGDLFGDFMGSSRCFMAIAWFFYGDLMVFNADCEMIVPLISNSLFTLPKGAKGIPESQKYIEIR